MFEALAKESLAPWNTNVITGWRDQATPLIQAAKYGCITCFTFLLKDPRTNPNIQDGKQKTALHHIIHDWYVDHSPQMCAHLLNLRRTNVGLKDESNNTAHMLLDKIIEEKGKHYPKLEKLSRLFDLRKMRVQAYLPLKKARCSEQCAEQTCSHMPTLLADVCFKIVSLLTGESLPKTK